MEGGIIDTREMEIEEAPIPRSLRTLVYRDTQGVQVEIVAEGRTASRHLEMSKEICPQSFSLPRCVSFAFAKNTRLLISSYPLPSIFHSFQSLKIFNARVLLTI